MNDDYKHVPLSTDNTLAQDERPKREMLSPCQDESKWEYKSVSGRPKKHYHHFTEACPYCALEQMRRERDAARAHVEDLQKANRERVITNAMHEAGELDARVGELERDLASAKAAIGHLRETLERLVHWHYSLRPMEESALDKMWEDGRHALAATVGWREGK